MFYITWQKVGTTNTAGSVVDGTTYNIQELVPGTNYKICVLAVSTSNMQVKSRQGCQFLCCKLYFIS